MDGMKGLLLATEIEFYIQTMQPQSIHDIGTKHWLEWHQRLQKLNQEALIEASQLKEEYVKESLVTFGKIPVLVHEAILINIWKHKILPQLFKLNSDPLNTFMGYSILYHEAICVALLELVMYHSSSCEALGDAAADLLDYSCALVSQLLSVVQKEAPKCNETGREELLRQQNNLTFDIAIRSLAIVRYLCENLDQLPIGLCVKIYEHHDVPTLFAQLLQKRPWIKEGKQYSQGKWMDWDGEALGPAEAQVWLTLRHLLLDPACRNYYAITNSRRAQFGKLLMLLTPCILDQVSPLVELKHFLSHVCMAEQKNPPPKPILIETILEIKEKILKDSGGKWKDIAKKQLPLVFSNDRKTLMENAQLLSEAFNMDLLEKFETKQSAKCEQCNKNAIQRCSQCKKVWYCSRICQVAHWEIHKGSCCKTEG